MTQFDIPESYEIPFFDRKSSLIGTITASSSRRKMNPFYFAYRKTRNIILYRLAFFCPFNKWRIWMHRHRGCHIGEHVFIGNECSLDNAYPEMIYIEDYAGVNGGSTLLCHTNVGSCFDGIVNCSVAPVVIRHHALVSLKSIVLPGVEIGEYALVSAGSVVMSKVAPCTMVAGNPAKKVYKFDKIIEENKQKYPDKMW